MNALLGKYRDVKTKLVWVQIVALALLCPTWTYAQQTGSGSDSLEAAKNNVTRPEGFLNITMPNPVASGMTLQDSPKSRIDDRDLPRGAKDTTTINFRDTDLRDIFRGIAAQHGLNIFLDNAVNRRVTVALTKVRVVDAITFLSDQNNLAVHLEGGIFRIAPIPPPPIVPPPQKIPIISYENHLFSTELKNDNLERVIEEIQKKTGFNILLMNGTSGLISGTLNRIEFDIGFTQLMNNNGFAVQKKNGIYLVNKLDYYVGSQNAPSQVQGGPYWVSVKDSLVSIDVTNAPVDRVIPDVLRQLNTDAVFYNQPSGVVTVRATNVTLARALDLILKNTNFSYRESDGLYFIGEKTNKALAVTKLLKLKYLRVDKVTDMIPQSISSLAVIKPVKEHNGLVVIASNDVIEETREFLRQVDRPIAQVLIEALVVDYDLTGGKEFGIEAGLTGVGDTSDIARAGSLIPGFDFFATGSWLNNRLEKAGSINLFGHDINIANLGVLPEDFYLRVRALEQKGLASIKSRPLIATLNGQQATLSIGTTQYFLLKTTIPYRDQNQVIFQETQNFQTIEADVKLEITPYVGSDSLITVEIKPDFRTPVGQFNSIVPPTINRRALSSTVIIREGETIILGGLIEEGQTETRHQVPILGSIPILGSLFSSTATTKRKSELIIYVTPHISYGENFQNVSIPETED